MNQINSLNEYELLRKFCEGDEAAFDFFYQTYSLRIYRKLLKMVKVDVVAQELLQDVFVKIWEKRHLVDPAQSFRSYLFRIAENSVFDFYRKLSRDDQLQHEVRVRTPEGYTHTEEVLSLKETENSINQAIDHLSGKQKQVFILCKLEGKSYEEVSRLMGISISTVNGHIVNATKFIKNFLFKKEVWLLHIPLLLTLSLIKF
ncbi:RNA polymerase sigma-70 factor [Pseudopedobacter sp.]|uniref:RNA polymerase sigma factor n=1 Tax=Pseudopedobacter sp. TaxID=1936787 RepID=UPI00333E4BB3